MIIPEWRLSEAPWSYSRCIGVLLGPRSMQTYINNALIRWIIGAVLSSHILIITNATVLYHKSFNLSAWSDVRDPAFSHSPSSLRPVRPLMPFETLQEADLTAVTTPSVRVGFFNDRFLGAQAR